MSDPRVESMKRRGWVYEFHTSKWVRGKSLVGDTTVLSLPIEIHLKIERNEANGTLRK